MTDRLALRPIAEIMKADHADRTGHSDQGAEIDADMLEPPRAFETPVDQATVHPDRMPEAQRDRARRDKQEATHPRQKKMGPSTTAGIVIVPIHSDFAGAQRTLPSTGSVSSIAKMRSEPGTSFILTSAVDSGLPRCEPTCTRSAGSRPSE